MSVRCVFTIYEIVEDGKMVKPERWDGYEGKETYLCGDYATAQDAADAIEQDRATHDSLVIVQEVRRNNPHQQREQRVRRG